jgi:hypothetical protein
MKKINSAVFILLIIILFQGCSKGHDVRSLIPAGATATFDANNILGNGTYPTLGCANTSWVNLENNTKNGTIACTSGGGYAGIGSLIDPRRVVFNGTDISVATSINAQPSVMPSSTWIIWAYPTNMNDPQQLLSIDSNTGITNRALALDNGSWSVYTGAGDFIATTADGNAWQQIAVVFTPTSITLYKNGNAFSHGLGIVTTNTIQNFTIGKSAGANVDFYEGAIGWIAVYPRALTPEEISNSCKQLAYRYNGAFCN